ncbi:MAG: helix-turn-helix transcriptional regulator, partial [Bacteroidales bacterium]|nr:helix-turn-helix transcriptional regulator [Bacteroidales bacterium]
SQQYVSKILKGCENLSLETLSKIESALNITVMQTEFA